MIVGFSWLVWQRRGNPTAWSQDGLVDASRCATDTGSFSILFTVWKENAPNVEFAE